jgi:hypothetical protein
MFAAINARGQASSLLLNLPTNFGSCPNGDTGRPTGPKTNLLYDRNVARSPRTAVAEWQQNVSAPPETGDRELLKFGETLNANPEPSPARPISREGVDNRRSI